jgi:hypothetical protein
MVAPTPTLSPGSVSVNLGSLPQDVTDIKNAVGTPATTLAAAIGNPPGGSSLANILGAPQGTTVADAIGALTRAVVSSSGGSSIGDVIGDTATQGTVAFNAQQTWETLEDVDFGEFATKDQISGLARQLNEILRIVKAWAPKRPTLMVARSKRRSAARRKRP